MDEVIISLEGSKRPGAMFCGPQKLRDSVKRAIRTGRILENGNKCAMYDENSDL